MVGKAQIKMKTLKLPNVFSKYGAPMGRRNSLPDDTDLPIKLRMIRLKWVDGDYDEGGAYWGYNGCNSVYWANGDGPDENHDVFVRAMNRRDAKAAVREILPNARFYR